MDRHFLREPFSTPGKDFFFKILFFQFHGQSRALQLNLTIVSWFYHYCMFMDRYGRNFCMILSQWPQALDLKLQSPPPPCLYSVQQTVKPVGVCKHRSWISLVYAVNCNQGVWNRREI